jgi:hypothetical protein
LKWRREREADLAFVLDGRVGREVVGVVAEKGVVAPRDGERSLVLFQSLEFLSTASRFGRNSPRLYDPAGPEGPVRRL